MTKYDYVHGYTKRELLRLEDQANTIIILSYINSF